MNIVLIGYRCCGKSVVSEALAAKLCRKRVDTDKLIENLTRQPVGKLVSLHGWNYFRRIEKSIIKKVSAMDGLIISTGGGVVMDAENVEYLRKNNNRLVWLSCAPEILAKRMENDRESGRLRPSLTGKDPILEIKEVLELRKPYYAKAADYILDTGSLSIKEVADLILDVLPLEGER